MFWLPSNGKKKNPLSFLCLSILIYRCPFLVFTSDSLWWWNKQIWTCMRCENPYLLYTLSDYWIFEPFNLPKRRHRSMAQFVQWSEECTIHLSTGSTAQEGSNEARLGGYDRNSSIQPTLFSCVDQYQESLFIPMFLILNQSILYWYFMKTIVFNPHKSFFVFLL